jgi:hypothetical protein
MRPQCFKVEDESCPNAWIPVKHNPGPHALDVELSATGWTFF